MNSFDGQCAIKISLVSWSTRGSSHARARSFVIGTRCGVHPHELIIFARRPDLGRRKRGNVWLEEILTWMTVQVLREDREPIARLYGGRTHVLCLASVIIYAAVSKSFFAIRARASFFSLRHSSRADRTLTLRELSVLGEHRPKNCVTHLYICTWCDISWNSYSADITLQRARTVKIKIKKIVAEVLFAEKKIVSKCKCEKSVSCGNCRDNSEIVRV